MNDEAREEALRLAKEAGIHIPAEPGRQNNTDGLVRVVDLVRLVALARASQAQPEPPAGWVSVKDRLPELHQSVVLLNVECFENVADDWNRQVHDAGYLESWGGATSPYWSIRGKRATAIEAYTHWMPLPAAPSPKGKL